MHYWPPQSVLGGHGPLPPPVADPMIEGTSTFYPRSIGNVLYIVHVLIYVIEILLKHKILRLKEGFCIDLVLVLLCDNPFMSLYL